MKLTTKDVEITYNLAIASVTAQWFVVLFNSFRSLSGICICEYMRIIEKEIASLQCCWIKQFISE